MEDHEEHLEHEEQPSKKRRIYVATLAIFLLLIVTIYFIPGEFVLDHMQGQIISGEIDENYEVQLREGKVIFAEQVYKDLVELYNEDPKNEFKVCLLGYKEGDNYQITSFYEPKTYLKTLLSVHSESCTSETIIPMHSHPFKQCKFSKTDLGNYERLKAFNKDALLGLMCEETRFTFYPN